MGLLTGNGVRFGSGPVLGLGEGLETVMSLIAATNGMPAIAGLTAHHLAQLTLPGQTRCIYLAREQDEAGTMAANALYAQAKDRGIVYHELLARHGKDLNDDHRALGLARLREVVGPQLRPEDHAAIANPVLCSA